MLTSTHLRSQIDVLWLRFWSGGINNPLNAIEQMSYLIFLKRLEDSENAAARKAARNGARYASVYEAYMQRLAQSNTPIPRALDADPKATLSAGASGGSSPARRCCPSSATPSSSFCAA